AFWRAANYLTVGQIYLQDNPLLREPLAPGHVKPRLLGHWGTSPGLSLIYAHMNRAIRMRDLDAMFLAGPGHGGPAVVANVYLEGTYSEIYPQVTQDLAGMRALFRQFSTPGGVPSHVGPQTPGSIHEGGELGYVLTHAFGAAFDDPELLVVAVVGDGEAETGPLEGSWKGISYLHPARDGAVLPVLHLNGYKISGPTVLGRASDADIMHLLEGHGFAPRLVTGDEPSEVHRDFAQTLDDCLDAIAELQRSARAAARVTARPRWPVIVLRTPKGWTGPGEVDGVRIEGTFRAHQVPLAEVRSKPEHLALLEAWMKSYRPEELFDDSGRLVPALAALAPRGARRMSANPRTNGMRAVKLQVPAIDAYAVLVPRPGRERHESTRRLGELLRDLYRANPTSFRLFSPDETSSNRLGAVFEASDRCLIAPVTGDDDHVSPEGRVMEVLSEHNCEGWLEGYVLTGRHGVFATYEAFALIVASMATQHAKWLEAQAELPWRAPVPSLNILLTSTCWRNDHNGFSHQGPGFMDTILSKKGTVSRIYLPPDANCLLSVAEHCLHSRNYVNLLIIDKQPQLQWLDLAAAREHCARGASRWDWASNDAGGAPDVVLACAGDIPTQETLAAAAWLRDRAPTLRVRVVNVVDLMTLAAPEEHPHGMTAEHFNALFTPDCPVVFAFHGYAGAVHQLLHGRSNPPRFHVRGYREEGTTTTPFDMVVLNGISRFHLVIEALRRADRPPDHADLVADECRALLQQHAIYIRAHLEDMPQIQGWTWR
ncbi:MAG TPA: phosphoketolase family protein, partial [Kofleriaceae bacterium]|nr:phosphoketolase family protein [Kofleriaceae bacterium]